MARSALFEMSDSGAFMRTASTFRYFNSRDPNSRFPPESGRYHLYVSYACPWAFSQSNSYGKGQRKLMSIWDEFFPPLIQRSQVLWDKKFKTIVSNESAEIIRMLNTEFNDIA
ncbi:hypothetical protein REPUB_Repub13aG0208600 [Reevesia pubescens]